MIPPPRVNLSILLANNENINAKFIIKWGQKPILRCEEKKTEQYAFFLNNVRQKTKKYKFAISKTAIMC